MKAQMQRVVKELVDAVGLEGAIAIIKRWGGRELYVPTKIEPGDALALTVGLDTARKLAEWCDNRISGRRSVQLPSERNTLLDLRNEAIIRGCIAGRSHESLGLEFGLTRQMVSRLAKLARERGAFAGVSAKAVPTESKRDPVRSTK